ncbi:hypothetical protein M422DRAFT_271537 [Sphaerobolus stellatus SS14]|uniref:Uncharacterized protein n=1 Tax=Sphaerobolus stellatus (strain SS14) TaxID=990650 RepID=A0A0C9TDI3_SPHS4|nr:hypothetical protein M422DRAFT_271537 [Sphaerobolus stellatus SS14]
MNQVIYAAPQVPQQQDSNNKIGGSENVHSTTNIGARCGYANGNVNANANSVGNSVGGYQSQSQSPERAVAAAGGMGDLGLGVGGRYTTQPTPGTGTVLPPLQPVSAALNQLQMQLESLCPLLAAYTNSNNANSNSDATANPTHSNSTTSNASSH